MKPHVPSDYRMPAEWEPHLATWLAWPYDPITFPRRVEKAEQVVVAIIKRLHTGERIELLVRDADIERRAQRMLRAVTVDLTQVRMHRTDYADVWTRDYLPTFIRNHKTGRVAAVKWTYNAYGEKFPELLKDNNIWNTLSVTKKTDTVETSIVMEGGAIDVNGAGVILTTEECLLNPNRNPSRAKNEVEDALKKHLGAKNVIWLREGLVEDSHTDGHIDNIARFVDEHTILCALPDDPRDPNYAILENAKDVLQGIPKEHGGPFTVSALPLPMALSEDGKRFAASYLNFYIGNS